MNDLQPIRTLRLVIRPYEARDAERLVALLTDDTIRQTYMIPDFQTPGDALALAEKIMRLSHDAGRFERGIYLDGLLIGFMNDVEIASGDIELGYVIDPSFRNRGFAAEALSAAIAHLFARGFTRVICGAFEENGASLRVMEKCGMQLLDRRETIAYRGENHPCAYRFIART